jgi:hypothetical protein
MVARLTELGATLVQWAAAHRDAPLAEQEVAVLAAVRAALPTLLEAVVQLSISDLDPGVRWVARRCPACARRVRVQGLRPRQTQTRCGAVRLTRPWYHCRTCGHGFSPVDATLGLAPHARLSPGLQDWVVHLGTAVPYREAAALLGLLTGLAVAPDTIRAQTTAAGTAVEAADQQAIAQVRATREAATPVEAAPGTLVVETDGAMVHYRDGWHEVKVGVVGGAQDGELTAASYVAAREPAEQFGPRLLAEAARRGALDIVRWEGGRRGYALARLRAVHVVGDGAPWIWHLAADHFGERTEVVDFYHAAEHVWAVARAVYGADTDEARVGAAVAVRAMRLTGAAPVRAALAALHPPPGPAAEVVRVERGYFATNAARMDYPTIADQGLPLGSGAVEASAGHVLQQRMKRPGQRWSITGGAAMCALRARRASGRPLTPFGAVLH